MLVRGAMAGLVALLLASAPPAGAQVVAIRCDDPPPPIAPERLRSLREVTLEEPGAGAVPVGTQAGFGGADASLSVDAGALAGTLHDDLARLFAAVPGDASGADGLRLVVRIADVSTSARAGALRGTVASRVVLSVALRPEGGGAERWSGAFEGRAERKVFAWRSGQHAETLSEAYCVALRRLASGLPRVEPGAPLEAAPRPEASEEPLIHARRVEGRAYVTLGAFAPRAIPHQMFALGWGGGWVAVPGVELGVQMDWHHAAVGSLTFSGSGRTTGAVEIDEFPLLAYARIGRPGTPDLLPYAGVAGGWDLCFVAPSSTETEIFGAWTWQAFAGVAVRIRYRGERTRATVGIEAMYQGARPAGSYPDAAGVRQHEELDMTGFGLRLGLGAEF